jgi:hypothetical protein
MKLRLSRPRHSTIAAYLALFVAMGGTGYAASHLPKNSVGTRQLKKNAVTGAKVKPRTLRASDVKAGEFATPANLAHINAAKLGGIAPAGFVQGSGRLITGQFTGTQSPPPTSPLVTLPGGGGIGVNCDSSGYATFQVRSEDDPHTYDRFTTVLTDGNSASVAYKQITPSAGIELVFPRKTNSETTYDISSDAGYAHVVVFAHFDNATNECTLKARGWRSP